MKISNVEFNNETVSFVNANNENQTLSIEEFENKFKQCAECGEYFDGGDLEYCYDTSELYCENCISAGETVVHCGDCGELISVDNALWSDDACDYFCKDCVDNANVVARCYHCDDICYVSNMTYATDVEAYVCNDCRGRRGVGCSCEGCGDYFYDTDNLYWDDDDDCYYCESCYNDVNNNRMVHSYHTSKDNGDYYYYDNLDGYESERRRAEIHFGYELEIDNGHINNNDMATYIDEIMPDFHFFENDGSLDSGFEIISNPASLNYMEEHREDIMKIFKKCVENGYRSHDAETCGLHVHVDREFFGNNIDIATAKILFIFNRFWKQILAFSRRNSEQASRWAKPYDRFSSYDGGTIPQIIKNEKQHNLSRYHAVNLTNRNTIEFRIARGTLNVATFFATLKLYVNICNIAKNMSSVQVTKLTWEDIIGTDEELVNYWNLRKDHVC